MGDKRVALVTGANKGIGFEIAKQLGNRGVTVLVGARDEARGIAAVNRLKAQGIAAQFVLLDVKDQHTIDEAADSIAHRYGKLDILVNNAGIFLNEPLPSGNDVSTLKEVYETNVFGVFRMTKTMLPLLRKSDGGRIVNMSSSLGSLTLNSDPDFELATFIVLGYNSSKTGVNALTVFFANELRNTPIKVNSADPGYCATDMNGYSGPRSPEQGASVAVYLATLPDGGPTGGFFNEVGAVPW
ncbi:SDR family oxidoreductase [Cohnella candidum]|uniref:SDR family oxidoreductase n=1 Tax=Cohnella candidum TaxID=2674991 RepID=A0A3G3JYS9_9BACL|nr:SDR family oxidoreductase [Cohnella candidum]AYQ73312.1 SDR family oxidoreductase [Cohnella candidum]